LKSAIAKRDDPQNSVETAAVSAVAGVGDCFHCGLPVPPDLDLYVNIDGVNQPMCCHGCQAVADSIIASGHANFYRVRTEVSPTGQGLVPEFLRATAVYDVPEIQDQFVHSLGADMREASLILEGITCAACIWLNEQYIAGLPGVTDVRVNYATQRALVRWDETRIKLSEILQSIQKIGYRALPYNPDQQQESNRQQRRLQLRRLAVAGLFGMQVMMISISLYAGAWSGMEASFEQFFRWLSLGLTLPVMLYSATPFFISAGRDLARRQVGMDVPVSLAIGIAFAMATINGQGEIYFDSVVMFVFFLSASRYFENMARQRCAASVEQLAQSMPVVTTRLAPDGGAEESVAAATLAIGDRVLVRPGETIPADGEIISGFSALDESLLNGESIPVDKNVGDRLLGGSINVTNPLQMEVKSVGADTVMAEIQRTIERAQAEKPPLARLADRVAARFISFVLLIVISVAVFWWLHDAERWFEIALAVLIVSCPCALSLATPTAISASLGKLQSAGLLVKRGSALENLNRVTHVVFDKTGTLTRGRPRLERVICSPEYDRGQCLQIAAALEQHSEHPLARVLVQEAGVLEKCKPTRIASTAGGGICASIDDVDYFIGNASYIASHSSAEMPTQWLEEIAADAVTVVVLARADRVIAMFTFVDDLREDAKTLITHLQTLGKSVILMTGDGDAAARRVADLTGISDYRAQMSPHGKMEAVQALQRESSAVLMIGDGVNDAPVLSSADVSIAMGGASSLAKTSADIVLTANHLPAIAQSMIFAAETQRIVYQNMGWALMYNFGAIPAAAMGLIAPWLAALGMSVSSLLVVLNALRLTR
jgi:Cu2+-exporting ATPase